MIKLTVGICTYNRKYIIENTSKSLNEINNIDKINMKVYDDCSNEYDIEYLKKLYPTAIKIDRSNKNLGADYNTKRMYQDFLESDDEYLFNADSDLIFNKNLLEVIENKIEILEKNNELVIFSVFNTPMHKIISDYDESFCIKKEVGAAGIVLSRKAIQMFMNGKKQYTGENTIDNFFCDVLKEHKIFCTKKSYVQHLGLVGQNSPLYGADYGKDFEVDTITNANAIIKVLEDTYIYGNEDVYSEINRLCINGRIGIKKLLHAIMLCIKYKITRIIRKK